MFYAGKSTETLYYKSLLANRFCKFKFYMQMLLKQKSQLIIGVAGHLWNVQSLQKTAKD